jgi:putative transposase
MIEPGLAQLSVRRQCEIIGLARSSWYYEPGSESAENLALMRQIDKQYLKTPFYGSRKMAFTFNINRKHAQRLMALMGLAAIYQRPRTTIRDVSHKVYPYLLRNVPILRPDHVWSTDITYVPVRSGYVYLVAVIDWFSRRVLSWRLSNSLEGRFCLEALDEALSGGRPEIFNTDQGVQFTSLAFTGRLEQSGVAVSMDGRGRALDNVFVERLWRSVKYENVYLNDYETPREAESGLADYFEYYNHQRPHQALDYRTPAAVYAGPRENETTFGRKQSGCARLTPKT